MAIFKFANCKRWPEAKTVVPASTGDPKNDPLEHPLEHPLWIGGGLVGKVSNLMGGTRGTSTFSPAKISFPGIQDWPYEKFLMINHDKPGGTDEQVQFINVYHGRQRIMNHCGQAFWLMINQCDYIIVIVTVINHCHSITYTHTHTPILLSSIAVIHLPFFIYCSEALLSTANSDYEREVPKKIGGTLNHPKFDTWL